MVNIIITAYAGLEHAFEADHLLAVNNLVTNRHKISDAAKDGVYWGIGHTTTLFVIGLLIIALKYNIDERMFSYFEACVGGMLVLLGVWRLVRLFVSKKKTENSIVEKKNTHQHKAALGVGMVHGLAGSGALVVLVLTQMKTIWDSLFYIVIFGLGSIIGMFLASALFSIPFSRKYLKSEMLQVVLIVLSSVLCIAYGVYVIYENLAPK
ncbi:MAG: sulfite exporter TauE/SafE family protein [Dysgonamonadaceae bacterium]|jgi:cytochrome c biogenesis protein CcdA|nr:sulfite exporter TauE/SafE family protein [Dysgonamonadaceae bacterium]